MLVSAVGPLQPGPEVVDLSLVSPQPGLLEAVRSVQLFRQPESRLEDIVVRREQQRRESP
ncbi:hypothetical protein [Streptosporangium vulgare]|uniref:hypothetical protein n=1 Tax=Streptosporangium vulgare TaxID=46190 RepID=UPI0031E2D41E